MALDSIVLKLDQSTAIEARELLQFVNSLRATYELGTRIRAKMRHNFNDQANPIDWTTVETLWGVPTGKGDDVFTFVDGAIGSLEGTFQTSAGKDITETVIG